MDWICGFLIGLAALLPMFVMICQADEPVDKEDEKTLMGALD